MKTTRLNRLTAAENTRASELAARLLATRTAFTHLPNSYDRDANKIALRNEFGRALDEAIEAEQLVKGRDCCIIL